MLILKLSSISIQHHTNEIFGFVLETLNNIVVVDNSSEFVLFEQKTENFFQRLEAILSSICSSTFQDLSSFQIKLLHFYTTTSSISFDTK
jgi:hypothetical protein